MTAGRVSSPDRRRFRVRFVRLNHGDLNGAPVLSRTLHLWFGTRLVTLAVTTARCEKEA